MSFKKDFFHFWIITITRISNLQIHELDHAANCGLFCCAFNFFFVKWEIFLSTLKTDQVWGHQFQWEIFVYKQRMKWERTTKKINKSREQVLWLLLLMVNCCDDRTSSEWETLRREMEIRLRKKKNGKPFSLSLTLFSCPLDFTSTSASFGQEVYIT